MDKPEWKVGSKRRAVLTFIKEFLPLLILPIIVLLILDWVVGSVGGMDGAGDIYKNMMFSAMIFSIPLMILSIPLGFYAKGNSARIPFAFAFPVYIAVWVWLFTHGGNFPISIPPMDIGGLTISSMDMVLNIAVILYITTVVCVLKGLMSFTEYSANREKFQEKLKNNES